MYTTRAHAVRPYGETCCYIPRFFVGAQVLSAIERVELFRTSGDDVHHHRCKALDATGRWSVQGVFPTLEHGNHHKWSVFVGHFDEQPGEISLWPEISRCARNDWGRRSVVLIEPTLLFQRDSRPRTSVIWARRWWIFSFSGCNCRAAWYCSKALWCMLCRL